MMDSGADLCFQSLVEPACFDIEASNPATTHQIEKGLKAPFLFDVAEREG